MQIGYRLTVAGVVIATNTSGLSPTSSLASACMRSMLPSSPDRAINEMMFAVGAMNAVFRRFSSCRGRQQTGRGLAPTAASPSAYSRGPTTTPHYRLRRARSQLCLLRSPTRSGADSLRVWQIPARRDVFPVTFRSVLGFMGGADNLIDPSNLRKLIKRNIPFANLEDAPIPRACRCHEPRRRAGMHQLTQHADLDGSQTAAARKDKGRFAGHARSSLSLELCPIGATPKLHSGARPISRSRRDGCFGEDLQDITRIGAISVVDIRVGVDDRAIAVDNVSCGYRQRPFARRPIAGRDI